MTYKNLLRLLGLSAFLLCGCNSSSHPSDVSGATAQPTATHSAQPHGFITAAVDDPAMNGMEAQTMTIPAGWKLQGIVMTSPCTTLPSVVYRAYAPDGLTEMRLTPTVAWKWSTAYNIPKDPGCLPFTGPMTAADFLSKYAETIPGGVHVVGPMPVDPTFSKTAEDVAAGQTQASQQFARNAGPHGEPAIQFTSTEAALHIQTTNGTFVIDQRLRTAVHCEIHNGGVMAGGNCSAQVDILRAPKGKLDALARVVDDNHLPALHMTPDWKAAQIALIQKRGQEGLRAIQHQYEIGVRAQKAMFDEFMETTTRNHEEFMNEQESRFQSSMANAQASQNARVTAGSDMVDYALDQQTVVGQGGYAKVSNAYTHTWSSTVGNQTQWYQTENPNADPNGVLSGNWTQDVKVHGNGQPY